MAISFKDSLYATRTAQDAKEVFISAFENKSASVYAADSWTLDGRYEYYPEYHDDAISSIDENKNIILDGNQINLTQETNSQYIPFEMPRYYDGFDLLTTNILFHFVNKEMYEDFDSPINLYYSDSKIKFGWLIDERVTAIDGVVKFEIQAVGVNSLGEEYIWKTKPSNGLNILKSLEGAGVIEPDSTWMTSFMSQITAQVSVAQTAANEAKESAEEAKQVVSTLPLEVSDDGYAEITNQRKVLHVQSTKSADTINIVVSMEGGKKVVLDVEYGANNYPASMTVNGHKCTFGWSGF